MSKKQKDARVKVILECTEHKASGEILHHEEQEEHSRSSGVDEV